MKLSVVTTLYKSAAHIEEFYQRASAVAREYAEDDYEIIMVDDGSPDNSLEIAIPLTKHDTHLKIIELSRNFGHHKAIMTGLMHTEGDEVFLIDVDLEEAPEWLIPFAKEMENKNVDVVYGVQDTRKGDWFEKSSGNLFYNIFNFLSKTKIPANFVTARLMCKEYVRELVRHKEHEIFLGGLLQLVGFKQAPYTIHKLSCSTTSYTIFKKISLFSNAIISFSNLPLYFIFYFGLTASFISLCYIIDIIWTTISNNTPVSGWASTIASIWFFGGSIIACIGFIGIYLAKIFIEVKQRPYTIIRRVIKKEGTSI